MNSHPYGTAFLIVAISAATWLGCLARWAWHKGSAAKEERRYKADLRRQILAPVDEDLEHEHQVLIAKHRNEENR